MNKSELEKPDLGDVLGYLQQLVLQLVVWPLELIVFRKLDELAQFVF
jgi:hypothetical protein